MRRSSFLLAAGFVSALAAAFAARLDWPLYAEARLEQSLSAPSKSIVYGGDQQSPPYEYLDEQGRPEG